MYWYIEHFLTLFSCFFTANSVEEFETWKEGLRFLVHDTQHASYSLQEERYKLFQT